VRVCPPSALVSKWQAAGELLVSLSTNVGRQSGAMSDFLERMPDFLPTWDHSGMNAGTWVVVIAAVTLYFNWQYTRRAQE
jgi:hypothetical protein